MSEKELEKTFQSEEAITDKKTEDIQTEEQVTAENTCQTDKKTEEEIELNQLKDTHLRLMAEYENYRKRTVKEKADLITNGGEKVLIGLLSIMDDLERAMDTIEKSTQMETLKEGIDLIYRKFLSFLLQNGLKAIHFIDEPFNPDLFEAVAIVPAQNEEQKGKIISSVQTGYTLNNKVIRHAKVIVAH